MNTYKYTDETETLVHIVDEQGNSLKSMDINNVPEGTVIHPAFTAQEKAARDIAIQNQTEMAALKEIDIKSIRDIREWIASQPDAPQMLKDREAQAIAARSRIK